MDPFSILGIAGTALSIAHKSYEAGEALGLFIHDVKNVDQNLKAMAMEIKALGAACNTVGTRVKGIAEAIDTSEGAGKKAVAGKESPLWIQVKTQLDDCGETVSALDDALSGISKEHKKNFIAQAWKQMQLNMRAKDIEEARNRIRSHTASLQLVLQAITLEVSYLAPQKADQQLILLLENIKDIKKELSQMQHTAQEKDVSDTERRHDQKELELITYTDKIISSGETLYEGSIAGGSVIGPSADLDDKITSWVSRLQVLSTDDHTRHMDYDDDTPPGSAISGADGASTDLTSDSGFDQKLGSKFLDDGFEDEFAEEEEDDMQVEMIKEAYSLGITEFDSKNYAKANELLQEVLTMVEESPVRSSRIIDVRQLRWMLAVCAYHVDDFQTAEVALKEIVQIPPQSQDDRVRLCEAGHILALASLKQAKLSEARQYCDSALQGRRRLLGKTDPACYESIALLARIFELQDNGARAAIYARMIPEDQRDAICAPYKALGESAPAVGAASGPSANKDKDLPPLPPGPPPPGPPAYSATSPTETTSPTLPPDQKWRFRPPIPTKRPVEYVTPKKDDSSDDEDPFAAQKAQEAHDRSMSTKIGQITGDIKDIAPPYMAAPEPQDIRVYRAGTMPQPDLHPEPKQQPLPSMESPSQHTLSRAQTFAQSTPRQAPARAQSYGVTPRAPAQPAMPAIPAVPAVPAVPSVSNAAPVYTAEAHTASRAHRAAQLNEILAFQGDVIRAKQANKKGTPAVQNALRNYASAVHDFDLADHEARNLHEDVILQAKGTLDDSHPLVYKTYANLAKIAESEGDFNTASDLYQKVLSGMRKNPTNEDGVFKTTVQSQLAEAYMTISKPDKAYSVLSDELRTRRKVYGSRLRSIETADCARRLAEARNMLIKPPSKHAARRMAKKQGSVDDSASVASADSGDPAMASSGSLSRTTTNTSVVDPMHDLLKTVHPALASRMANIMSPPPQQR